MGFEEDAFKSPLSQVNPIEVYPADALMNVQKW